MNIANNLANAAFFFPERCAVMDGDRQITYRQLDLESSKIAAALAAAGVQAGDHVALCAPNSYEWLAFYFGVLKVGAVAVTFSHMLAGAELPQILADCRPRVLYTIDEKLDDFGGLPNRNSYLELVISEGGDISFVEFGAQGTPGFKAIARDRDDTAAILYTGGTTGIPKGAMLSHANIQTSLFNVARYERSTEADRALCFLPLNHVFGQIHITWGYLNNPAETESAFWSDWFRSGDIGRFDDDGYLYIVDRLKDMIITGGENVYPREVEEVLYTHPKVQECAVVGLPDKDWGERVTAFIVPHTGHQPDSAALKTFLKGKLAGFKVPKEYVVVDELPKNNAGKLLKREIKVKYG